MRAAVVLNPRARRGHVSLDDVLKCLSRHGVEATAIPLGAGDVEAAMRRALAEGYDTVVVGGGDGTLSTAANVLHGSAARLGILPLGTANDFARSLGIPREIEDACAVIGAGHTVAVDVGEANGRRFLNVVSLGLPAKVSAALTADLKRRWGVLAYPIAAAQAGLRQRPFTVTLTVDGHRRRVRWVMQLAIGSGRNFGGGMAVTDAAEPTDGYLNVHVITAPNLRAFLWTMRHLRSGRYAPGDSALRLRARTVRVELGRRHRVNADGELIGYTPLDVTVHPHALRVFAPPPKPEQTP